MSKKNLALGIIVLIILAGGAGYYFWGKGSPNTPGTSSFDIVLEKVGLGSKLPAGFKEYKDPAGIFSIRYPSSWLVRSEKGILLEGVSLTPSELSNQYSEDEKQFVKGLVAAATESTDFPATYYENLVGEGDTGQTEAKALAVNGYPAYMVKGNVKGVSYVVYVVSNGKQIVYFNYRTKEEESAHQKDIRKSIDFGPYVADFEAAVNSIKFLK